MSEQLVAIKKLYFSASKHTIERDFDEAIELLKAMPSDEERERAAVFMEGLAEMKRDWFPPRAEAERRPEVRGRGRTKNRELRTKNGTKN